MNWKPTISLETLHAKAQLLQTIRQFFLAKNILEVQTPLLCSYSVTDPYIESIATHHGFLQTSPEYAMKKLLALHKQSIYQICKAFREEENGRWHSKEFTMLEWYVVHADMFALIEQVSELVSLIFPAISMQKKSYRDLFLHYANLDPFTCSSQRAYDYLVQNEKLPIGTSDQEDSDDYLQIIMSEIIEPQLDKNNAIIIYDYPSGQSALAKLTQREYGLVAERFELYVKGIECGNGFHELQDPKEQLQRFQESQQKRKLLGLRPMAIDNDFIQALEYGLPNCSGIAVGLDRLCMLKENSKHIKEVL